MGKSVRGAGGTGSTRSRNLEQDEIGKECKRSRGQGKHQEQELGAGRDWEKVQEEHGERTAPGAGTGSRTRLGRSARGAGSKGSTRSRNWEQDEIGKECKRSRRQGNNQVQDKITKELQTAPGRELQEAPGRSAGSPRKWFDSSQP